MKDMRKLFAMTVVPDRNVADGRMDVPRSQWDTKIATHLLRRLHHGIRTADRSWEDSLSGFGGGNFCEAWMMEVAALAY